MEIYQAVGQNIHRIRKAQQLSIDRAAALSGVSKSMLGQIERGLVNPTVSVLARIAGGLHVPIEQLVECREETPAQLHRAVDVVGARLCGGKVIRYPLFPFDTDSRCQSCQLDLFISGGYDAPDRVPGSRPGARRTSSRAGTACPSPAARGITMKTSATTPSA